MRVEHICLETAGSVLVQTTGTSDPDGDQKVSTHP